MIYTQAAILETHRHSKVLPNGVLRRTLGDIKYKDYIIRKVKYILQSYVCRSMILFYGPQMNSSGKQCSDRLPHNQQQDGNMGH
jgi:hypothetical protein